MQLVIAIPCYEHMARQTALSLAMLTFRLGQEPPKGLRGFQMQWRSSCNLPESRHALAVDALQKHGATHILWIDSDSEFPPDSVDRLLAHDKPIVGCSFARRVPPHYHRARGLDEKPFHPDTKGLVEASVIGFGLTLTKAEVFQADYEMPLFDCHDDIGYCGSDVIFCRKAIKAGFRPYVDMDLSREVRHIGSQSFGYEHLEAPE